MASIIQNLRFRTLTGLALLIGMSLVGTAFAQGQGYKVPQKRTTSPGEHENAIYIMSVIGSPPNTQVEIVFMQTQGTYPYNPWKCVGAVFDPPSQSHSCSKESQEVFNGNPIYFRETVTIGSLPNSFCADLRTQHNLVGSPHPDNPIMYQSECPPGGGVCSCYEVLHECRQAPSDPWGGCPTGFPVTVVEEQTGGRRSGDAPPGRGAGSGSNN
jgi:hypothetical protein